MRRVFVTRRIPDEGLRLLEAEDLAVHVGQSREDAGVDRASLLKEAARSHGLLSLLTEPVDRELLEASPGLLGVANCAVGYDNVDVEAATELGVPVSNTPGVLTDTTADLTWALLLGVARRIPEAHEYTVAGRFRIWGPNLLLGADVSPGGSGRRKVLGIVGPGRIGAAVAERAAGFRMEVLAHGRSESRESRESGGELKKGERRQEAPGTTSPTGPLMRRTSLDELLERSDFVSLHLPLTEATHHLIGEAELRRMKESAYLINTSRGAVVDEEALVKALREGWIAGAGLDVYENEPALTPGLAELDNVIVAPHIGSASRDTRARMATMAAENLLHHLRGERAPNVVNPQVYETEAWEARRARSNQ